MTPIQVSLTKLIAAGLLLLAVFGAGYYVRGYMANYEKTLVELSQQKNATVAAEQYAKDLGKLSNQNQALRDRISTLDTKYTKDLNEKLAENSALRRDLGVAQRMRLAGTSCPQAGAAGDHPSSTGVGDGGGVELSAATRSAVWDLRESILGDQAKLAYLQEERRTLTCAPKTPE